MTVTGLTRVPITTAGGTYDVLVGPGAVEELPSLIPSGARTAAVVSQERIGIRVETGIEQMTFNVPDGEGAKALDVVEELCRSFARSSLTRRDVIVAVGGGVVTDLAGFAASVYHRGIAYVNVATSLLGQVDAAIGGKTGVNLPEGKNLVGSFWQPRAVLCDTDLLATLPDGEMRSGMGEVAKYAFLNVPGVESVDARKITEMPLADTVARCVAVKAAVVRADERETRGLRAVLNYGHTLAHALEAATLEAAALEGEIGIQGWGRQGSGGAGSASSDRPLEPHAPIRHGEAVANGLIFAARLARRLGRISEARVGDHEAVVRAFGLPTALPRASDPRRLVEFMAGDKKGMFSGSAAGLTFVLDGPRGVELVDGVDPELVVDELGNMEVAQGSFRKCEEARRVDQAGPS